MDTADEDKQQQARAGEQCEQQQQPQHLPEGSPKAKRRRRVLGLDLPEHMDPASHADPLAELEAANPGWWQPQPHATLDTEEKQDRPAAPLARALSCALCHGLLREAMAAVECGHTFCYDCVEARVDIGGNRNVCPVPGCPTVLGPNPFDHHRLMYDSVLDALVQKVFPRPALDAALAARRAAREDAVRQARAAVNSAHRGAAAAVDSEEEEEEDEQEEAMEGLGPSGVAAGEPPCGGEGTGRGEGGGRGTGRGRRGRQGGSKG